MWWMKSRRFSTGIQFPKVAYNEYLFSSRCETTIFGTHPIPTRDCPPLRPRVDSPPPATSHPIWISSRRTGGHPRVGGWADCLNYSGYTRRDVSLRVVMMCLLNRHPCNVDCFTCYGYASFTACSCTRIDH